jgi:hypothetical protein
VIPSTEVAGLILRIAYAAVRCQLALLPLFGRNTFRCAAILVAKRPSHTATINAWPDEVFRFAEGSDTHFSFDIRHGPEKMCHGYLHDWRAGCASVRLTARAILESEYARIKTATESRLIHFEL